MNANLFLNFVINIMEYNPDFSFELSKEKFKRSLANYINSQDSDVFYNVTTPIYGMNAIKNFRNDVLADYGLGRIFTDKSFWVLYEHKKLMLIRLQCLKDHTGIKVEPLIELFEEAFHISKTILLKCNEFKENRRFNIYPEVIDLLDELTDIDRVACSLLLDVL